MLDISNTALVLIDVQGKLATLMHDRDVLFDNLARLVKGCLALDIPILWTEQLPDKLGPTIPALTELLKDYSPIPKASFSCCGDDGFQQRLAATDRQQILLAGIETHVCIYQTAADLREEGREVQVVADAVSSRSAANRELGLERLRTRGVEMTSVESALFDLMRTAEHPAFRSIIAAIK